MSDRYRKRERSRSRSPYSHSARKERQIRRERDPRRETASGLSPATLPFQQRQLTKDDLPTYRPLLGLYLDIQKQIDISEISETEVKGRWKSFLKKWNHADLAEGWYEPRTLSKAIEAETQHADMWPTAPARRPRQDQSDDDDDDDDDFGPSIPTDQTRDLHKDRRNMQLVESGPTIPSLDDLRSRDEDARYRAEQAREQDFEDRKSQRKIERKERQERLEDIAPRAPAGTRERQLENKRELAASNREFASTKDGGDVELRDSDIMGEDTLSELKRIKQVEQRKKSEREVKREEILRARAAEREERSKRLRDKEAKTMDMLKEIARSRFGDGNTRPATLHEG